MVQLRLPIGPAEKDCPKWEGCSAPLCPQSPYLARAVWFPGEGICRAEAHRDLRWLRIQAEIARLPGKKNRGYFSVAMLRAIKRVGPELTGKKDKEDSERQRASGKKKPKRVSPPRRGHGVKICGKPAGKGGRANVANKAGARPDAAQKRAAVDKAKRSSSHRKRKGSPLR